MKYKKLKISKTEHEFYQTCNAIVSHINKELDMFIKKTSVSDEMLQAVLSLKKLLPRCI